jgi:hypothetical protein
MADERISYQVNFEADTSGASEADSALEKIEKSLGEITKETRRMTQQTEQQIDAQREMVSATNRISEAWRGILGLNLIGFFQTFGGVMRDAFNISRDWATSVQRVSRQFSISLEDAAALQTSWALAGVDTSEALSQISSFQGRLIEDLEKQKEVQKQIIELDERRAELLVDLGKAQTEHAESIAELEEQITEVGKKEIAKRIRTTDESLRELEKDYNRFLDDQVESERDETERLSRVWQERVRRFERDMLSAQSDLAEGLARATSTREQKQIKKDFDERVKSLETALGEEKTKHDNSVEEQAQARRDAIEDEKQAMEERAAFIREKSDEDLALIRERNAEQVASLQERIEQENEAWAEQQSRFSEGLSDIDKAQAEAMKSGGSLKFIVDELGISMFDASGKMRPVNELIFELKDALDELPPSARKAAIIADLGWEDLANWIEDGASATEALTIAQNNNLIPSQETLEAIRKQNEQLALLQLQLIGVSDEYTNATVLNDIFLKGMIATNEAIAIASQLYEQVTEIIRLLYLWKKSMTRLTLGRNYLE